MWFAQAMRAVAEALGIIAKRQELNNTPEMIAAKKAQAEVDAKNRVEKAVEKEDAEEIRKHLGN